MLKNGLLWTITGYALTINIVMFIVDVCLNGQIDHKPVFLIMWGVSLFWMVLFAYVNIVRKHSNK